MTANQIYLTECCYAVRVVLAVIEPTAEQTAAWVVLYLAQDDATLQDQLFWDVLPIARQVCEVRIHE